MPPMNSCINAILHGELGIQKKGDYIENRFVCVSDEPIFICIYLKDAMIPFPEPLVAILRDVIV